MNDIVYLEVEDSTRESYVNKETIYNVLWYSTIGLATAVIGWLFYSNRLNPIHITNTSAGDNGLLSSDILDVFDTQVDVITANPNTALVCFVLAASHEDVLYLIDSLLPLQKYFMMNFIKIFHNLNKLLMYSGIDNLVTENHGATTLAITALQIFNMTDLSPDIIDVIIGNICYLIEADLVDPDLKQVFILYLDVVHNVDYTTYHA
jgi:hypothetical protein